MPDPSHNNEAAAEYVSYYASKQMLKNTVNRLYHHGMARQRAAIAKAEQELYPTQPLAKRSQAQIEAYLHDRVEKELLRRQQHRASLRRALYGDETLVEHKSNNNHIKYLTNDKHSGNYHKKSVSNKHSTQEEEFEEENSFLPQNEQDRAHHAKESAKYVKGHHDTNKRISANKMNKRGTKNVIDNNKERYEQDELEHEEKEAAQRLHRHRYLTPHELQQHLKHVYTDPVKRRARREAEIENFLTLYGTTAITPNRVTTRRHKLNNNQAHSERRSVSSSMSNTPIKGAANKRDKSTNVKEMICKQMSKEEAKLYEEERLRELEIGWRTPSLKVSHDAEDVETLWVTPSMEILQHDTKSSNKQHALSTFALTHHFPASAHRSLSSSRRSLTSPQHQRYLMSNKSKFCKTNKNAHHTTRSVSLERLTELARPLRVTPRARGSDDATERDQNYQLTDSNHKPVPKFHVYRKVQYNDEDAYL